VKRAIVAFFLIVNILIFMSMLYVIFVDVEEINGRISAQNKKIKLLEEKLSEYVLYDALEPIAAELATCESRIEAAYTIIEKWDEQWWRYFTPGQLSAIKMRRYQNESDN
jgi:hypothetical protein